MRRLRYGVAMSFDGFIAGPNGEYDWIVSDPSIDFAAMFALYDTFLMGRKREGQVVGPFWPALDRRVDDDEARRASQRDGSER